eukprot:366228-Chlamydomonas_euryale.AAC.6
MEEGARSMGRRQKSRHSGSCPSVAPSSQHDALHNVILLAVRKPKQLKGGWAQPAPGCRLCVHVLTLRLRASKAIASLIRHDEFWIVWFLHACVDRSTALRCPAKSSRSKSAVLLHKQCKNSSRSIACRKGYGATPTWQCSEADRNWPAACRDMGSCATTGRGCDTATSNGDALPTYFYLNTC